MKNNIINLETVINRISKERSIDKQKLIDVVEEAYLKAAHKRWPQYNFETEYDSDKGDVKLYQIIDVVEEVEDPKTQTKEHAGHSGLVGDQLVYEIKINEQEYFQKLKNQIEDFVDLPNIDERDDSFNRIAINNARNLLQDKISELNKQRAHKLFKDQEGQMVSGKVRYVSDEEIAVDLGKVKAVLPYSEVSPRDNIKPKDNISAIIKKVHDPDAREQIILSRTDERFVQRIMEEHVQELKDGRIEIVDMAREPGTKTKVAVKSNEKGLSATGPCIGYYGSRIKDIRERLGGEKIDVIEFTSSIKRYAKNALSLDKAICNEGNDAIEVSLPEEEMGRAIGRGGKNIKLASKLVGKKINLNAMKI